MTTRTALPNNPHPPPSSPAERREPHPSLTKQTLHPKPRRQRQRTPVEGACAPASRDGPTSWPAAASGFDLRTLSLPRWRATASSRAAFTGVVVTVQGAVVLAH